MLDVPHLWGMTMHAPSTSQRSGVVTVTPGLMLWAMTFWGGCWYHLN
jgi:hypothetical protein